MSSSTVSPPLYFFKTVQLVGLDDSAVIDHWYDWVVLLYAGLLTYGISSSLTSALVRSPFRLSAKADMPGHGRVDAVRVHVGGSRVRRRFLGGERLFRRRLMGLGPKGLKLHAVRPTLLGNGWMADLLDHHEE